MCFPIAAAVGLLFAIRLACLPDNNNNNNNSKRESFRTLPFRFTLKNSGYRTLRMISPPWRIAS